MADAGEQGQPPSILLIDDEAVLGLEVSRQLKAAGYTADVAWAGHEALARIEQTSYDVVIVDLNLPDMRGEEIAREVRRRNPDTIIMILTGAPTLDSAIAAVEAQAVQYLIKPVDASLVVSAVANALRKRSERQRRQMAVQSIGQALGMFRPASSESNKRYGQQGSISQTPLLHVPPLRLNTARRLVTFDDDATRSVELSMGEMTVLFTLMSHPNQVFSCVDLARFLHNYVPDETAAESVVRPLIARLRQKIEFDPKSPNLVCTVRGCGYYYAAR